MITKKLITVNTSCTSMNYQVNTSADNFVLLSVIKLR